MSSNGINYQVPDLASILRTLSAYGPSHSQPVPVQQNQVQQQYQQIPHGQSFEPRELYANPDLQQPNAGNPPLFRTDVEQSARCVASNGLMELPPTLSSAPTHVQKVDPTVITEWSAGLRCATKLFASNEQFGNRIRKVTTYPQ